MSTIKQVNFPTLVRDGGWRERRIVGERFWTDYFRVRWGVRQTVKMENMTWTLRVKSNPVFHGTLDQCLIKAESV